MVRLKKGYWVAIVALLVLGPFLMVWAWSMTIAGE